MTTIYFIRHAEPDTTIHDDYTRPLTIKGEEQAKNVSQYLKDKNINLAFSSPYKRAVDTILPFTNSIGIDIKKLEGFRERKISNEWIEDFTSFAKSQWEDFTFKLTDGENLEEVQIRNIDTLKRLLLQYPEKNIVVGTHGTALSTMINYYNRDFGYDNFKEVANIFPWIVKMVFDGEKCLEIEHIEL